MFASAWCSGRCGLLNSLDDLLQQIEFFVDTVSGYKADCIMFPEFFNAPLMALTNEDSPAVAIRAMAAFSEPIKAEDDGAGREL